MARMIPQQLAEGGAGISAAEKVLFKEFARQLGPEWTVLHSVHWLARDGGRSRDGEADFLLAHPRHGVLIMEVKGGAISRDGATARPKKPCIAGAIAMTRAAKREKPTAADSIIATIRTLSLPKRLAR